MNQVFAYFILILCFMNLTRMAAYLISSDVYSIKRDRAQLRKKRWYLPSVTVLVPAHNEALTIERNLRSLVTSTYPKSKLTIMVINDGSTDDTANVVRAFKRSEGKLHNIVLINRPNRGKAAALNFALSRRVKSTIVMCLDADSTLAPHALRNAVQHFRDRKVVALSSNINIIEDGTVLSLVQRFEYIMCYQMKKGQALLGVEYIVGGIGSVFRYNMLKKVSFYDSNTMTEDIDLTMKIIVNSKRGERVAYAADSIAYTEPAHSMSALMRQRYRWKYGRSQTFLKNISFFFSRDKRHAKRLSWFMLPYSIIQDILFFFEPIVIGFFVYLLFRLGDARTLQSAVIVLSIYMLVNVWSTDHLSVKERLRLSFYAPPMYFLMIVLSIAEYYALLKTIVLAPKLKKSIQSEHTTWASPERRTAKAAS